MSKDYLPTSDFLRHLINHEVPFVGYPLADSNLSQLIDLTTDADTSNRDWAVLLLMQTGLDSPEIRSAFLKASADEDPNVRAEALLGLAKLDRDLALPLVQRELQGEGVNLPLLEAAEECADPSLIPLLEGWLPELDEDLFLSAANDALNACRT